MEDLRLNGEAECAIWSRHSPYQCFASTDNGAVCCYDVTRQCMTISLTAV